MQQQNNTRNGDLARAYNRRTTGKLTFANDKTEAALLPIARSSGGDTMAKMNAMIITSHCHYWIEHLGGYVVVKAVWPATEKDMVCCKVVNFDGKEEIITVSRYQKFDFFLGD